MVQRYHFCPWCGGSLHYQKQQEQNRLTCVQCEKIFYENPVVGVAGILLNEQGRVLLGRRSPTSTYSGLWCIPCGYVEYDEEVRAALQREFLEETGLVVKPGQVFTALSNFHNPAQHTVGIWFWVEKCSGLEQAGDDLSEVAYFSLETMPPLAFPTDQQVLAMLLSQSKQNK